MPNRGTIFSLSSPVPCHSEGFARRICFSRRRNSRSFASLRMTAFRLSLRLQADVLDELRPANALVLQELREVLRRSGAFVDCAQLAQPLRHLRVGEHLVDVAVDP